MKLNMDRHAADNKYLHRDFHLSADQGLVFIADRYGDNGVRDYLQKYTKSYYAALIRDIKKRGLLALKENIEKAYEIEEASDALQINFASSELLVEVKYCPAVRYMMSKNHTPSRWYIETTRVIYETIANETNYCFSLLYYEDMTGAAKYRFFRGV